MNFILQTLKTHHDRNAKAGAGFDSKPKCCTDDNLQTVVFTSRLK